MHMISKKDLSDAEMDTLTKSCSPTIVITANGEVQMHEEAIVYVKELDIFLTMKVLENTPAVLSLGKLCDENGYSYEWINGQKPHLIKNGIRIQCNTENFVPIVVPKIVRKSQNTLPPHLSSQPFHEVEVCRKKGSVRGKCNHGSILRQPCRFYLKGTCTRTPCDYWHPPECHIYKNKNGL